MTKPLVSPSIPETPVVRDESLSAVLQSVLSAPTTVTRDKSDPTRHTRHHAQLSRNWHSSYDGYHSDIRHSADIPKNPIQRYNRHSLPVA